MYRIIFTAFAAALLLSGCQTYQSQNMTRARQNEDRLIQQENQRRMSGRIEQLEMEVGRISHELDSLRQTLDSRYTALERKTEADKRETVSRLSTKVETLIKQATPAAPPPSSSSSGGSQYSGSGYEHIVQPGETLSAIAKAYGVTTKIIIQANRIKDPDRLGVGQKLFIPE